MASSARTNVNSASVISALNTPGGVVYEWRDEQMAKVVARATATAPVNDPLNALHRGGGVGEFKRSFRADRIGSNQHRVRATIFNTSDHAVYAELGRSGSRKRQVFTWAEVGGELMIVGPRAPDGRGTAGREGSHTLRNAVNAVMRGTASPLP